jgi:tetratricopeptide (TPR) repeat protein
MTARPEPFEEVWILDDIDDGDELDDSADDGIGEDGAGGGRIGGSVREADGRGRSDARWSGGTPGTAPGSRRGRGYGESGLPAEVVHQLSVAVGSDRGAKLGDRLAAAARAYERDRYLDALRISRVLVDEVPESAAARELHGLVCYRLGRWRDAIRHLTAASDLEGDDPSQLPVLMDCHRALGHHRRVRELWDQLREASPSADILVEGRLVFAADLAEQDKLAEAIELLLGAGAARDLRRPGDRHIRQWYLLADLCERAGDIPRARELFARVVVADPEMADAGSRLAALGTVAPTERDRRSVITLGEIADAPRTAPRP